jgi:hypothetical protein
MDPALESALALVLRDVRATAAIDLEVRDETWPGAPSLSATIWEPSGSGSVVYISDDDASGEQIAAASDQIQEIVIEALWHAHLPVSWPVCREHPTTHPLAVNLVETRVVWLCPITKKVVAEVGTLGEHQ